MPAKARFTGKPSPSKEDGALVTETTGRCAAPAAGAATRGSTVRSLTVMAGMRFSSIISNSTIGGTPRPVKAFPGSAGRSGAVRSHPGPLRSRPLQRRGDVIRSRFGRRAADRTVAQTSRAAAQLTSNAATKRTSASAPTGSHRGSTTAGPNSSRAIERTGRGGVRGVRAAVPAASGAAAPVTGDVPAAAGMSDWPCAARGRPPSAGTWSARSSSASLHRQHGHPPGDARAPPVQQPDRQRAGQ